MGLAFAAEPSVHGRVIHPYIIYVRRSYKEAIAATTPSATAACATKRAIWSTPGSSSSCPRRRPSCAVSGAS